LNYYALANEYRVNRLLGRKIHELGLQRTIRVPEPRECIHGKGSLSIVSEYVAGQRLDALPLEERQPWLGQVLTALETISRQLADEDRQQLTTRPAWLYGATLPAVALLFWTQYRTPVWRALRWLASCTRQLVPLRHTPLMLAHRDLMPENVIVKEGIPYLIDSERMVLTLPFYDLVYMSVHPDTSAMAEADVRWPRAAKSPLRAYVFMHAAADMARATDNRRSTMFPTAGWPTF